MSFYSKSNCFSWALPNFKQRGFKCRIQSGMHFLSAFVFQPYFTQRGLKHRAFTAIQISKQTPNIKTKQTTEAEQW